MPLLLFFVLSFVSLPFLGSACGAPFDIPTDDAKTGAPPQPLYTALPAVMVAWGDAEHPPRVFAYSAPIERPDNLEVAMPFEVTKTDNGTWCATPPHMLAFPFENLFLSVDSRTVVGVPSGEGAVVASFDPTTVTIEDFPEMQLYVAISE